VRDSDMPMMSSDSGMVFIIKAWVGDYSVQVVVAGWGYELRASDLYHVSTSVQQHCDINPSCSHLSYQCIVNHGPFLLLLHAMHANRAFPIVVSPMTSQ
jgi:hypothetical protein